MISELQEKLEKKDFEIAKQYFTIRDYRASVKANENFIAGFPGTKFREESMYIKFLSLYEIAVNSILSKKQKRLNELKQQYDLILRYYPETLFLEDLNKKIERVNIELSNFNLTTKIKQIIMTKYRESKAAQTTKTYNRNELEINTKNIYEALSIIAKRSQQINLEIKKELHEKLDEFATHNDSLEEIFENKEQIEVSRFYERLPKPHAMAIEEWLKDKIYSRQTDDSK